MFTSNQIALFYPLFAMFVLVNLVMCRLGSLRISQIRNKQVSPQFHQAHQGGEEPKASRLAARNLANLFEVPILFYVLVLTAMILNYSNEPMLILCWIYVVLRYAHSFVHVTFNHVPTRFIVYCLSCLTLILLWIDLLVTVLER